jgi:ABC-type nitrate/sulfonate/bicarbonate transport system ATPase subunit
VSGPFRAPRTKLHTNHEHQADGLPERHAERPRSPAPGPLLEVDGVSHGYLLDGRRLAVLQDLSLALAAGGFAAVVGPSGAGKSTLLGLIAGLEEPEIGRITLGGSPRRLGRVGYMPQRDLLHPWRNALDNATVALEVRGVPVRAAREQARALFAEFGLAGFEQARPHELSGGMRQRVALARSVLAEGELILLDEPFGALDALTRARMQDWLLATWPRLGRTGLLVTHDVDEALLLADEVYVLSARPGRLLARLPVPLARPRDRAQLAGAAASRLKLEVLGLLGLTPDLDGARA